MNSIDIKQTHTHTLWYTLYYIYIIISYFWHLECERPCRHFSLPRWALAKVGPWSDSMEVAGFFWAEWVRGHLFCWESDEFYEDVHDFIVVSVGRFLACVAKATAGVWIRLFGETFVQHLSVLCAPVMFSWWKAWRVAKRSLVFFASKGHAFEAESKHFYFLLARFTVYNMMQRYAKMFSILVSV